MKTEYETEAEEISDFETSLADEKIDLKRKQSEFADLNKSLGLLKAKAQFGELTEADEATKSALVERLTELSYDLDMDTKRIKHIETNGRVKILSKWAEKRQRDMAEELIPTISFGYDLEDNPVQFARDCSSLAGSDQYSIVSTANYLRIIQERLTGGREPGSDDPRTMDESLLPNSVRSDMMEEVRLKEQMDFHAARLYALEVLYKTAYDHHDPAQGTYFPKFLNKSMGEIEEYVNNRAEERLKQQAETRRKMRDKATDYYTQINRAAIPRVA